MFWIIRYSPQVPRYTKIFFGTSRDDQNSLNNTHTHRHIYKHTYQHIHTYVNTHKQTHACKTTNNTHTHTNTRKITPTNINTHRLHLISYKQKTHQIINRYRISIRYHLRKHYQLRNVFVCFFPCLEKHMQVSFNCLHPCNVCSVIIPITDTINR